MQRRRKWVLSNWIELYRPLLTIGLHCLISHSRGILDVLQKTKQNNKQTNKQSNKQTNKQTKQNKNQTNQPTNQPTNQTNKQTKIAWFDEG